MNKRNFGSKVSRSLVAILLSIMVLSTLNPAVWAKNDTNGAVSATIKLTAPEKVGNAQLTAGEYKVSVDGSQAKFQKGNKVVAEVPCTLKPLDFMPHSTSFVTDKNGISEIQVAGNIKAIEFSYEQAEK